MKKIGGAVMGTAIVIIIAVVSIIALPFFYLVKGKDKIMEWWDTR